MIKYVIKRILMVIPVMLGVLTIVFILTAITPGDPVDMIVGAEASEEVREAKREELGLNDPIYVRYFDYIVGIVTRGDLGDSYTTKQPVMGEILTRYTYTLELAFFSIILSILVAIPLGVISAVKQYSWIDNVAMVLALIAVSVPIFWLGLMALLVFSVKLQWLPSSGIIDPMGWILPVVVLALSNAASITRITRSSMLDTIRQDYMRTARAKGQKERLVVIRHGLRNALIPIVTAIGNQIGITLGGAVMIEAVFALPGLGKYMVDAITARNYPGVQGGVVFLALVFSLVNLAVDILYAFIDPRIKAKYKSGKAKFTKPKSKPDAGKGAA